MRTFLLAAAIIAACMFLLCFNIIFRKDGKFPETDISKNPDMKRLGIKCMKEQEDELFSKKRADGEPVCSGTFTDACSGCGLFPMERGKNK